MAFDLNAVKGLGVNTYDQKTVPKQELGQEQFLKLLTTQLTNQDPTKPMENGDFLGQMAQFSTVSGIQDLQKSFTDFADSISSSQSLQAAGLVGRSVLIPSREGVLSLNDGVKGQVKLTGPTNDLVVQFQNKNGTVAKELHLGRQSAGDVDFEWDGLLEDGTFANPGTYQIEAFANIDGSNTALESFVAAGVNSVTMANGNKGIQLSLNGLGNIGFNQVKQIF